MLVLGIGDHLHDPSVCLMQDGNIIAAIEYERVKKIKHGVSIESSNYKIDSMGKYFEKLLSSLDPAAREKRYIELAQYCLNKMPNKNFSDIDLIVNCSLFTNNAFENIAIQINHHFAHAASAYFSSPYDDATILIADGHGNSTKGGYETISFFHGKNNQINTLKKITGKSILTNKEKENGIHETSITLENSLGALYKNITVLLGFGHFGEGSAMAFAGYGKNITEINNIFAKYIQITEDGIYIDNRSLYITVRKFLEIDDSKKTKQNIAFTLQQYFEKCMLHLCNLAYKLNPADNLCLAGGVFLNCQANSKILAKSPFKNIFIQPACKDSGIAIGCAQYGSYNIKKLNRKKNIFYPYLGIQHHSNNIQSKAFKKFINTNNIYQDTATLISQGMIVGWYCNESEFGPRALGNRSILADPRTPDNKDKLNKIKNRALFRPVAPAILDKYQEKYFDLSCESPYMLYAAQVKKEQRENLTVITHIDGSARIQTVKQKLNHHFYQLLEAFNELTGCPILANTSFNGKDEPIVETIEDAFYCAEKLNLDALFINGNLYIKSN